MLYTLIPYEESIAKCIEKKYGVITISTIYIKKSSEISKKYSFQSFQKL